VRKTEAAVRKKTVAAATRAASAAKEKAASFGKGAVDAGAGILESLKAFDAKRFAPVRGALIPGAATFSLYRPAGVYVDMILQNGSALERHPLTGIIPDAWAGLKGAVGKNLSDLADEFLGRGDRSDDSTAGSLIGAFAHGVCSTSSAAAVSST
jgi:hypothetical protein